MCGIRLWWRAEDCFEEASTKASRWLLSLESPESSGDFCLLPP